MKHCPRCGIDVHSHSHSGCSDMQPRWVSDYDCVWELVTNMILICSRCGASVLWGKRCIACTSTVTLEMVIQPIVVLEEPTHNIRIAKLETLVADLIRWKNDL